MSRRFLVDTSILIDFLRGRRAAVKFIRENASLVELSAVAVAELYAGVRSEKDVSELDQLCALFPVHPVTADIAREAGLIRNMFPGLEPPY